MTGPRSAEGECLGGTAVVARVVGVDSGTAVPVAATGAAVEEGSAAWVCCAAEGVAAGVAGLDAPGAGRPVDAVPDQVAATVTRAATAAAAAADSPQAARRRRRDVTGPRVRRLADLGGSVVMRSGRA